MKTVLFRITRKANQCEALEKNDLHVFSTFVDFDREQI